MQQAVENLGGILFLALIVLVIVLVCIPCEEGSIESQPAKVVSLTQIPEHWGVGIVGQNIYHPGPLVAAMLISKQYIVVIDVDGTLVEFQVSSERFNTLNVGDSVLYTQDKGIIDD